MGGRWHDNLVRWWSGVVAKELASGDFQKSHIAVFLNFGFGGQLYDVFVLLIDCLNIEVAFITVLHPVDRVKISKAGVHILTHNYVIWWAVGSPRGLIWASGSFGVDVDVVWEFSLEHATGFTGF